MSGDVWFTSDTHIGHEKMRILRGFSCVEEHDEVIVQKWNEVVRKGDRVYHEGDVGYRKSLAPILRRLNGQIHLVLGNHDKLNVDDRKFFASIRDLNYIKVGDQKIMLCHYAMRSWRGSHRGSWMLFGHSHGNLKPDPTLKSMDVGVDTHGLYPYNFWDIKTRMDKIEFVPVDHHGEEDDETES